MLLEYLPPVALLILVSATPPRTVPMKPRMKAREPRARALSIWFWGSSYHGTGSSWWPSSVATRVASF